MKFKDYLLESKQMGDLYHYTTISHLLEIVKKNQLGKDGKYEEVSLTRNKNLRRKTKIIPTECYLVINGNKLSENYKINPTTYYADMKDWKGMGGWETFKNFEDQQEERVKGAIHNVKKFIKKIIIFDIDLVDYVFDEELSKEISKIIGKKWDEISAIDIINFLKNKGFNVEIQ